MVYIDKKNGTKINLPISSTEPIGGCSMVLAIGSYIKSVENLNEDMTIELSTSELADLPTGRFYGDLEIYSKDGEVIWEMMPEFNVYEGLGVEPSNDILPITIVSRKCPSVSGSEPTPGGDFIRHSDFDGIEKPKNSINENNELIGELIDRLRN